MIENKQFIGLLNDSVFKYMFKDFKSFLDVL